MAGKDRRRVAHVADRRAVARQQDARGAIGAAQRVEARAQGGAVAVADRRGHLAVLRDAGGRAVALGDGSCTRPAVVRCCAASCALALPVSLVPMRAKTMKPTATIGTRTIRRKKSVSGRGSSSAA